MKKLIFSIIASSLLFSLNAQNYYSNIQDALEQYNAENYSQSCQLWEKAFEKGPGFSSDYYNAACTFSLAGQPGEALKYLEIAIQKGWDDLEWMQNDSDLELLKKQPYWNDFLREAKTISNDYQASLNNDLKVQLETLRMKDQTLRLMLPDAIERFGRDSEEYKFFVELMNRNDDEVLSKVALIINEHGWVGVSEVGELANQTLWLVIQHAPLNTQEKYLPLLKESVDKNESKAWYYAFLRDRILMRKGEPQIFGTQAIWDSEEGQNVIYQINDFTQVNQLRKSVGLNSIEKYAENNNYLLNSNP